MTEEQGLFHRCLMALQQAGVRVTTEQDTVTCVFPPDPDDPHAAPDGEEQTYSKAYFTMLVTRTFFELVEQDVIDTEGDTA